MPEKTVYRAFWSKLFVEMRVKIAGTIKLHVFCQFCACVLLFLNYLTSFILAILVKRTFQTYRKLNISKALLVSQPATVSLFTRAVRTKVLRK